MAISNQVDCGVVDFAALLIALLVALFAKRLIQSLRVLIKLW